MLKHSVKAWAAASLLLVQSLGSPNHTATAASAQHRDRAGVQGQSAPTGALGTGGSSEAARAQSAQVARSYGSLPTAFELNVGQTDRSVSFLARGAGYTLFLTSSGATIELFQATKVSKAATIPQSLTRKLAGPADLAAPSNWPALSAGGSGDRRMAKTMSLSATSVQLQVAGANPHPRIEGVEQLPGTVNYFIGNDPNKWHTSIPTYGGVLLHDVYPGIDLHYYGRQGHLEYDWMVRPGVDPSSIRLAMRGGSGPLLDSHGNLLLKSGSATLTQAAPLIYQSIHGQHHTVVGGWRLLDSGTIGFALGAYDRAQPLIIDPVLVYSTYLGGNADEGAASGCCALYSASISVDGSSNAYVAGETQSADFPRTAAAFQSNLSGTADTFVSKLNAGGTALLYSTYLGGSSSAATVGEWNSGIAIDGSGNAYVAGFTDSTDFPTTTGAYDRTCGSKGSGCSFITKLNGTGSSLLYSTLLGVALGNYIQSIAVDGGGNAYVTGWTASNRFPITTGAFQSTFTGGKYGHVAFVTKLNGTGSALVYSTYLGGSTYLSGTSADNEGIGIAVDGSGNAYVTGVTNSTDFPTTIGAFQRIFGGSEDAFVTKLNGTGTALVYSTYLGGNSDDYNNGIAVDGSGNAYVTGVTKSSNFPTTLGAYQRTYTGGGAFVTKLNGTGTALVYSTFLTGSGGDSGAGIAVDGSGDAYVTGTTDSTNFPTTAGAFQPNFGGGWDDVFVTKLNIGGTGPLLYSTYLGGSGNDYGEDIAVDSGGDAYLTGYVTSTNFPITAGAFQRTPHGGSDAFVSKLALNTTVIVPPPGGGNIAWHPHYTARFSDSLSASVDLADGHVDLSAADLSVPGRGLDLGISHTWDSKWAGGGAGSAAGQGWLTNLNASMTGPLTGTIKYIDDVGATWPFTYTGSLTNTGTLTTYQTPPGLPWQLTASTTSSTVAYTLTDILSGDARTFNPSGQLVADTNAYGNANSLDGLATNFANSSGRSLAINYAVNGLLNDVQSPLWQNGGAGAAGSRHVTYNYGGTGCATNQLCSLTQGAGTADAKTAGFGYTGNLLTTVTTPMSQSWTLIYNGSGQITGITSPISGTVGQPGYTPAYTTQIAYSPGTTTVTRGYGTSAALTTTYTLDTQGQATTIADGLSHTTHYQYDTDHDVIQVTDPNTNVTTNAYAYVGPDNGAGIGSTGLISQTMAPPVDNETTPITTTYTYDPSSHDLLEQDEPDIGAITRFLYDGDHSVITATVLLDTHCPGQAPLPARSATAAPGASPDMGVQPNLSCNPSNLIWDWRGQINGYDQYGELTSTIDGRGVQVSLDSTGTASLASGYQSYQRTWGYNGFGDLTRAATPPITTSACPTSACVANTVYTPDGDGNPTGVTNANGNLTQYRYDHLGRLSLSTLPPVALSTGGSGSPTEALIYDGDGNLAGGQDGLGDTTSWSYDPLGRLVSAINPVGARTLGSYSATRISGVTNPQGCPTTYTYDPAGRLQTVVTPAAGTCPGGITQQQVTTYQYDPAGNLTQITHGDGNTVSQTQTRAFDQQDELLSSTLSGTGLTSQTTGYQYDGANGLTQVINPNGDVTDYSRDLAEQHRASLLFPVGGNQPIGNESYGYDGTGNAAQHTDFVGNGSLLTFDGDNRPSLQQDTPVGATTAITTTWGFDPVGNALAQIVTDPVNGTQSITSTVNATNWMVSANDGSLTTSYGYDLAGRARSEGFTPVGTTDPVALTSGLDPAGRVTGLGVAIGASTSLTTTVTYTGNNQPQVTTLPGSVESELRQYDPTDRLTSAVMAGPLQIGSSYSYDPVGWTTALTTTDRTASSPTTIVLTHDGAWRLLRARDPRLSTTADQVYTYDANGNPTSESDVTQSATYWPDPLQPNEVISTTTVLANLLNQPILTYYHYDAMGNTQSITNTSGLGEGLTYDARNRLNQVVLGGTTPLTVTTSYNAGGQRATYIVEQDQHVQSVLYQYADGQLRGLQVYGAGSAGTSRCKPGDSSCGETFFYRQDGLPLGLLYSAPLGPGAQTTVYWYVVDGRGSVRGLVDGSGNVVDVYNYFDQWGVPNTGDLSGKEDVPQPLRYRGYIYDSELGTYWLSVRQYDPALQRFLQPDPSEQEGTRSYIYANDDPVDFSDPSGLGGPNIETGEPEPLGQGGQSGAGGSTGANAPETLSAPAGALVPDTAVLPGTQPSLFDMEPPSSALGAADSTLGVGGSRRYLLRGNGLKPGPMERDPITGRGSPHDNMRMDRIDALQAAHPDWVLVGGGVGPRQSEEFVRIERENPYAMAHQQMAWRRVDITFRQADGAFYREQIGKLDVNGNPVEREIWALQDIAYRTGEPVMFTSYGATDPETFFMLPEDVPFDVQPQELG